MRRKYLIILTFIVILSIAFMILNNKRSVSLENNTISSSENINKIELDTKTGFYYVYNSESGEIIAVSSNQKDLDFFLNHQNYNPNPLQKHYYDVEEYLLDMNIE